jgi:hypothetical protein
VANRSLKLEDFADHELLYALEEHADADGTISSSELADALGLAGLEHPTNNVSSRLAWLKRYGIVYRDEDTKRWGFTPVGMNLMHGRLTAAQTRMLDNLDPDMLLSKWAASSLRRIGRPRPWPPGSGATTWPPVVARTRRKRQRPRPIRTGPGRSRRDGEQRVRRSPSGDGRPGGRSRREARPVPAGTEGIGHE